MKESLYRKSPVWLQNLGVSAYGLYWKYKRLGPLFDKTVAEFLQREKWDCERLRKFADHSLRKQIKLAFRNVQYYREHYGQKGFKYNEIDDISIDSLNELPLLEKDILRRNPEALLIDEARKFKPASYLSSGTTGTPTRIYIDRKTHQKVIAAREARSLRWAGVSYREQRSMIGGRSVVPEANSEAPFWRYNYVEKQLYMSAFHINPKNVADYVSALNRFKPIFMTGYASSHYFLARMILEQHLDVHSPRAIITGSEKLTAEMRETIETAFRTRVWEEYGSVENCVLATQCEEGRLHLNIDFGWVEILRDDGTSAGYDEIGEIVATGFMNEAQPLIRYRIGDYGVISSKPCSCGRSLPVLKELVGRLEDTVIGPDGREMVRFHGIFVGLQNVREGQVMQESLSEFTVRVVPNERFDRDDEAVIRKRFHERLGDIKLTLELVKNIPRTERGKFRAVISRVKRNGKRSNP